MEAVILAGGLGSRLRQAVPSLPKPLAPINGRPFLEYLLDYWINQGVTRVVLSVGYKHKAIYDHFGDDYRGCELAYAVEHSPLGTGGALVNSVALLRRVEPFLVLNGDTYFPVPLVSLRVLHETRKADVTLSLFRTSRASRFTGVSVDQFNRVTALGLTPCAESDVLANGGVFLFCPEVIRRLSIPSANGLSIESDFLVRLIKMRRPVFGLECHAPFVDIGIPEDYLSAGPILASSHSQYGNGQ